MKRILFLSISVLLAFGSLSGCKIDQEETVDPLASDKALLQRTVWHTTLEQYNYTDDTDVSLLTKTNVAGTNYAFQADGILKITDTQKAVTTGNYKLYKKDGNKFLEIVMGVSTETYLLTKLETQKMSWSQVKADQPYTINGGQKVAAKLTLLFNFDCACGD